MSRPLSLSNEGRDSLLAKVAFEAVWERDVGSDMVRWDGNLESIFGHPRGEVESHIAWWRERVHPDDLGRVQQSTNEAMIGDAAGYSTEYRFRRKDGSWAWVASRCTIERDGGGQACQLAGAMIDMSKLKETESRLRLFTEQIPARATATDLELRVLWDTGAAFSSTASVVGKTVPELFAQSPDCARVLDGCQRALGGESSVLDIDDGKAAARLHLGPFHDPAGNVTGVVGIAFDITDRVRSEARVREGQRLLRQVLDALPVGVVVMDRAGNITLDNPASIRIWGGTIVDGAERWTKSHGRWHGSGNDINPPEWASARALEDGQTSQNELIDIETYNGDLKTIENYAAPIRDAQGAITGAVVVNQDVTERVRSEAALRKTEEELARRAGLLETLSRRLIEAQETERRAIARELHDDLGQVLAALRLNLQRRDRDDPGSLALVDDALERVRDLAQQLRPPLLDERGLEASLRWYAEREAKRADLGLRLALGPLEKRLPVTLEAAIFRIAQEAISNIIHHAAAHVIDVELGQGNGALQLVVRDDGCGFDVAAARLRAANGESLGLINMQERVALAGGNLDIESAPGRGTSVRVRVPLAGRWGEVSGVERVSSRPGRRDGR